MRDRISHRAKSFADGGGSICAPLRFTRCVDIRCKLSSVSSSGCASSVSSTCGIMRLAIIGYICSCSIKKPPWNYIYSDARICVNIGYGQEKVALAGVLRAVRDRCD